MITRTQQNTITIYGTIWSGDGMRFVSEFQRLEREYEEIKVFVHTYGGSVFDGNLIFNALNKSGKEVKIIIVGLAASMGGIIALSRKEVSIVENGYIMLHAPSSIVSGTASDFENQAQLLRSMESNFVEKLISKTGKSKPEIKKWMVGDHWFDAKTALKHGFVNQVIDAVVVPSANFDTNESLKQQEVYNVFASVLTQPLKIIKTEIEMKKALIVAFLLEGLNEQSSDTAVIEALQAKMNKAEAEKTAAIDEAQALKDSQIKALITTAKIPEDKFDVYAKIGKTSGIEALQEVLAQNKTQAPNIYQQITSENSADTRAEWNFDKWQKEDPKGLEKLSEKDPAKFNELYNQKYNK